MDHTDQLFGGRYRIVGEVGRGGMGVIYRGVDSVLDREVAIKVMSADFAEAGDDAKARFLREAKAAAKLQHRNIVTVFEFAEQDGVSYIVMEFLKGKSLGAKLSAEPPMALDQKLDVITELCNGLQFAHENGVIHRDVKPANIWILDDGQVKLVDFGIAKISSSMMTLHGDVMGSAAYMSPEQIEGRAITGRSDVFSAAVVLFEMLARRRPFEGDSPTATMMQIVHVAPPLIESLVPGLPRELVAAIARGLAKNPDDRFQSAAEFGAELQLIRMALPRSEETVMVQRKPDDDSTVLLNTLNLKSEPLPPRDPTSAGKAQSTPSMMVYLGGAAAVLVVAIGLFWWMNRTVPPVGGGDGLPPITTGGSAGPELRDFRVQSTPPGAAVIVGGVNVGKTPVTVKIDAGGGKIQLQFPDYQLRDVDLDAATIQAGSGKYVLSRIPVTPGPTVRVHLSGPYPFKVIVNGETRPESDDHAFSAPVGGVLTLVAEKYFLNKSISVKAVRSGPFESEAPGLGDVYFSGSETCQIFLGSKSLDVVVKQELPQMAAGEYEFRFKCSDGSQPSPMKVTVVAGETVRRVVK